MAVLATNRPSLLLVLLLLVQRSACENTGAKTTISVASMRGLYALEDPAADHRAEAIRLDEFGDAVGALRSFRAAAKHTPDKASSWYNLGMALSYDAASEGMRTDMNADERAEVLHCFERALSLEPGNADAREALGEVRALIEHAAPRVRCDTTAGPLHIQLLPEVSPRGVARVVELVESRFFTNISLFRNVPGFLLQFGQTVGPSEWGGRRIRGRDKLA